MNTETTIIPRAKVRPRSLEREGGVRLRYTVTGDGAAVLFVQGVGVHGDGWWPQVDALCDRFTCLTFDNRGMGRSQPAGAPVRVEQMAEDALAIMDAEGIDRFHVVGHSMGGLIAQQVALGAPVRVKSLALLCTFARGTQGARPTPSMMMTALRTRIGTRRMRRNAFLSLVMPRAVLKTVDRDVLAEQLRPLFGHDLGDQPPIVMKQVRAMGRYDASEKLWQLARIPTLVISAKQDRIALPTYGFELASAIPGARFLEIEGAGHGVTIQRAAEINELLDRHFNAAELAGRPLAAQ